MKISLSQASEMLLQGDVVAVPTETVYGLAASLYAPKAIEEIYKLKGRPSDNPLIIHVASCVEIEKLSLSLPNGFHQLADMFWPGPLTLVLEVDTDAVPQKPRANLPTSAFRIPHHPTALSLLQITGPLVMPSANLSGMPSGTSAAHIESDFGANFPVLDGGDCACGVESTILIHIDNRWQIIRLGGISAEEFEKCLGYVPEFKDRNNALTPICPGQRYRHYAPKAKLSFKSNFDEQFKGIVLGFEDRSYPAGVELLSFGPSSHPEIVAENLYRVLRHLDELGIESAWIDANLPAGGLWTTIAERLSKAAKQ